MNRIKKGYLPYLIGEIACCVAEIVLFFFALYSDSLFAVIVALIAIAATGVGVWYAYKKSASHAAATRVTEKKKGVRAAYPLAIISIIFLCTPNVGIIDLLPDFIACFILARLISSGTERAPYFTEARQALTRLGWLSVAKIGGLLAIGYSRMQNAFGNDTSVVVVTVFSVAELILCISATTAIFNALFGLGERTDMSASIAALGKIPSASLPLITYAFFAAKAILGVIPSFFLLTRVDENGVISTVSRGYAPALVITTILVLICGIAWCVVMIKYLNAIHKEGQFYNSIFMLSGVENEDRIKRMRKADKTKGALSLFFIASIMLIDVKFDNTGEVNLLPNIIFGIITIIAICRLRTSVTRRIHTAVTIGGIYCAVSLVSYLAESYFLYNYGYSALLDDGVAHTVYNAVEILSVLEFVMLIALAVSVGRLLVAFTYENTAIPPSDERYSRADKDFHGAIKNRIIAYVALTVAVGLTRCACTISNGFARLVLNQQATATVSSALPWMGALTTALTVLLIGFSYYLFTLLKEEVDMKYGGE